MINREELNKVLDVMDKLTDEDATLTIYQNSKMSLVVYPQRWIWGNVWDETKRHAMLALITPLIGKLEKKVDGTSIGYFGENETISIRLSYVDKCKVVGYKTVTKTVKKEVERDPEYIEEEVEERVAITDCDLRAGKFQEDDIEVRA